MEFPFFGRQSELDCLERTWNDDTAQFLVLTGRRSVGKTALLMEWVRRYKRNVLYWPAPAGSPAGQLHAFSQALYNFFHPEALATADFTYSSWEQAFRELVSLAQSKRLALLLDDFPVLLKTTPGFASEIQIAWDHRISRSNLMLCLAGADRRLMLREAFSYRAPLFGRATAQIDLKPFYFGQAHSFFPEQSALNRMAIYAIAGGLPVSWNHLARRNTVPEMIAGEFLDPGSPLLADLRRLLKDFRARPGKLDAVLGALAGGAETHAEIFQNTGLVNPRKYLRLLLDAGFVERKFSLTRFGSTREKRYQLTDPALRFYFRFLARNENRGVSGGQPPVLAEIMEALPDFIGQFTWKELCREWLVRAGATGRLPVFPGEVGSIWDEQLEVEVAGIDVLGKVIFLSECRWNTEPVDQEVMAELVEAKAPRLIPGIGHWRVVFLGFARSGWNSQALAYRDEINRQPPEGGNWRTIGMYLLDLDQVDRDLDEMNHRHKALQDEITF